MGIHMGWQGIFKGAQDISLPGGIGILAALCSAYTFWLSVICSTCTLQLLALCCACAFCLLALYSAVHSSY